MSRSRLLVPLKISSIRNRTGGEAMFLGGIEDRFEPFHLGVEERQTGIERIVDADAAGQPTPGPLQRMGADRGAGLRQTEIDADRSQERTLAGHVGAGNQMDGAESLQMHLVCNTVLSRQ